MFKEIGTLAEIGAKVGDMVEWVGTYLRESDFVSYEIDYAYGNRYHAKGQPEWHDLNPTEKFRIIHRATQSPVRTVTRKEIVPGVYGKVMVTKASEGLDIFLEVHSDSRADLIDAIATLQQIADALDA